MDKWHFEARSRHARRWARQKLFFKHICLFSGWFHQARLSERSQYIWIQLPIDYCSNATMRARRSISRNRRVLDLCVWVLFIRSSEAGHTLQRLPQKCAVLRRKRNRPDPRILEIRLSLAWIPILLQPCRLQGLAPPSGRQRHLACLRASRHLFG